MSVISSEFFSGKNLQNITEQFYSVSFDGCSDMLNNTFH